MAVELTQIIEEVIIDDSKATAGAQRVVGALQSMDDASKQATSGLAQLTRAQENAAGGLNRFLSAADPVYRVQQQLARGEEAYTRALQQGIPVTEQQIAALERIRARAAALQGANDNLVRATGAGVGTYRNFGSVMQQAGFQVGDFAVQVASGQSAVRAFIQQGTQMLQFFGPWGAVIGAAGAVVGSLAIGMGLLGDETTKTKDKIKDYDETIEMMNELLLTAEERTRALTEAKLKQAKATGDARLEQERENLALLEQRKLRIQEAEFDASMAGTPGVPITSTQLDAKIEEQRRKIEELERLRRDLDDPSKLGKNREEALKRERELLDANRDSLESYISSLERERDMVGLSNREREIQQRLDEAINKAMAEGNLLSKEQADRIREIVNAKHDLIDRLKEQEKAQKAAQDAEKKAREQAEREHEKYLQDIERTTDRVLDNISEAAGDILFDYMEGRAGNFWETFERLGKRALANLVAEQVTQTLFRPIVSSAVSALPGLFGIKVPGQQQSGGFSLGGFNPFSIFDKLPFANGDFSLSALGLGGVFGGGAGLLSTFSAAGIPAATMGLGAGGLAAGGAGGALAGIGGLLGPAALLGGALALFGGFGKKSVGPVARANLNRADGRFELGLFDADNGGDTGPVVQAVQQVAQSLNSLVDTFKLTVSGSGFFDALTSGNYGGGFAQTPEELIRRVLASGIVSGTGQVGAALRSSGATTLEGLMSDLTLAKTIDELLDTRDPLTKALAAINEQFKPMIDRAKELGLAYGALEKEQQKQIDLVKKQFEGVPKGIDPALMQPVIQGVGGVRNFLSQLSFGPLSALTPEQQFAQAERQLQAIGGAAAAGDVNSLAQFQNAATQYLALAQNRFASGPGFVEAFNKVLGFADRIGNISEDGWRASVTATQQQTVTLVGEIRALKEEVTRLRREVGQGNLQSAFAA